MHTKSTPWAATLLIVLALVGLSACGQTGTEKAKSTESEPSTQQAARAPRTAQQKPATKPLTDEERTQRLLKVIWWNSDQMVKQLSLTDSQRSQLDSLLGEYLAQLRAGRDQRKELQDQLNTAAQAADWSKADEIAEQLAQHEAATSRTQTGFRLRGLKLLTPEQLKTVTEQYPHLVENPWVRFGAIRRAQQRRAAAGS